MLGTRAWKLVPLSAFKKIGLPKRLDELPEAALEVVFHQWLVAHHRHDTDRSKSGKFKRARTGLGQINAAAFNIRPSVRDRDRDGMTILLVGDLDLGTKWQRFVRRRHGVIVERDAAGSFGSRLRRVTDICLVAHLTSAKMLCDSDQAPYPTARRIHDACMQIEAFALEHPLRQAGAQTTASL
jgi:hypothetical protein